MRRQKGEVEIFTYFFLDPLHFHPQTPALPTYRVRPAMRKQ